MNICPLDFSRTLVKVVQENEQVQIGFNLLVPNLNFKIRAIPQMKLVSTPLSRILLGKAVSSAEQ